MVERSKQISFRIGIFLGERSRIVGLVEDLGLVQQIGALEGGYKVPIPNCPELKSHYVKIYGCFLN